MKKAIRVFEYGTLKENEVYDEVEFSSIHFHSLVRWSKRQGKKFLTSGYDSVTFKNYVGVIYVKGLTIEILPKADEIKINDKSSWQRSLLYMMSVANNLNIYHSTPSFLETRDISLMDFFIGVFIKETEGIIRKGLVKKYRQVDRNSRLY